MGGIFSILGALGGSKTEAKPSGGYATLPDEVKKAYEKTFLPDVMKYYGSAYHQTPSIRAEDFYAGQPEGHRGNALSRIQQYSDAVGGLFSPYTAQDGSTGGNGGAGGAGGDVGSMSDLASIKAAMMRNEGRRALAAGDYRGAAGRVARDPNATDEQLAKLFDATGGNVDTRGVMAGRNMKPQQQADLSSLVALIFGGRA